MLGIPLEMHMWRRLSPEIFLQTLDQAAYELFIKLTTIMEW